MYSLIRQFYASRESGERLVEAKVIQRDRAVYVMNAFTELYGIGPIGAREAYNAGARSFADVLHRGKSLATHLSVKESVRILGDLRQPIGRQECRAITEEIMRLVRGVLKDNVEVKYEICGGYRRGKQRTYDLDVIIGHTEPPSRALHTRLLDEMKKRASSVTLSTSPTPPPRTSIPTQQPHPQSKRCISISPTSSYCPARRWRRCTGGWIWCFVHSACTARRWWLVGEYDV